MVLLQDWKNSWQVSFPSYFNNVLTANIYCQLDAEHLLCSVYFFVGALFLNTTLKIPSVNVSHEYPPVVHRRRFYNQMWLHNRNVNRVMCKRPLLIVSCIFLTHSFHVRAMLWALRSIFGTRPQYLLTQQDVCAGVCVSEYFRVNKPFTSAVLSRGK